MALGDLVELEKVNRLDVVVALGHVSLHHLRLLDRWKLIYTAHRLCRGCSILLVLREPFLSEMKSARSLRDRLVIEVGLDVVLRICCVAGVPAVCSVDRLKRLPSVVP